MNRQAFRELSLRGKVQWFFQYYGAALAVVILAGIVGGNFLSSVFGPGEQCALKVMILDDRQSADNCQRFSKELGEALGGECEVTSYAPSAMYEMQAFAVRLTSDELDVIIAPGAQMDELTANGYLRDVAPLPAASRYQRVTRGGDSDGGIFIGTAVQSKHEDNASLAVRYFTDTGEQPRPEQ